MKKFLISIILCLCLLFSFGAISCGGSDECSHNWEKSLNNGILTKTCSKCDEVITEDKTSQYKAVCQDIADTVYGLNATPTSTSFGGIVTYNAGGIYKDATAMDYIQVKGVICFVEMLASLIDNPNFNLTDKPVKFTYSYASHGETGEATLMYSFDEENDKVIMYWLVNSTTDNLTRSIFLYMNIRYDFDNQELVNFSLSSEQVIGTSMDIFFGYRYQNSVLEVTDDTANLTAFKGGVLAELDKLLARNNELIDLQADFTAEYTAMMDKMNPQ